MAGLHDKDSMPGSCSVIIPPLVSGSCCTSALSSLRPPDRPIVEVIVVDNSHGESTGHALLNPNTHPPVVVGKTSATQRPSTVERE